MLTPELVLLTRRGKELSLPALNPRARETLEELASELLSSAELLLGHPRAEWDAQVDELGSTARDKKLLRGLLRLLEQGSEFDRTDGSDAEKIRELVYKKSALLWRGLADQESFDRGRVLREAGQELGLDEATVEHRLSADLPQAERLRALPKWSAAELVERYDQARVQAVLLRAVRVTVTFRMNSPELLRELFRALKFRRLLFECDKLEDARLRLTLDGPLNLFEARPKYGLELALLWPTLEALGPLELEAEVAWGKTRTTASFRYQSRGKAGVIESASSAVRDEVEELRQGLEGTAEGWTVRPGETLLALPGVGLCVPDLTFTDPKGRRAHLELLGFWSRESVWKRVDLASRGLPEPVLFACASRLRVSEEVLLDASSAALYVFRGKPSPRTVLERILQLLDKTQKTAPRPGKG